MKKMGIGLLAAVALLGFGQQAFGAVLPVTAGLLYQLDATDTANIVYDGGTGNMISWTSSQGSIAAFQMTPSGTAPTYSATGGGNNNLPNVNFTIGSKLASGSGGIARSVFIMENTTSNGGLGGMWGRNNVDTGIRFWSDNYSAPNTHQVVNVAILGGAPNFNDFGINMPGDNGQPPQTENYYWSDTTVIDGRQTWQNKNWGTLGAYRYTTAIGGASNWASVALGTYYQSPGRAWGGQIGEVIAFDRWLTDPERQQVETYLAAKWLVPEPATMSLLVLGGLAMLRRHRK
ncbi:MAG: PEP-CTERM sorting domain-containing protein [Planctomycetota bacterium]|nr:PEP-CTERM sorting domain-containing protein [Planctomycetota bacterium]